MIGCPSPRVDAESLKAPCWSVAGVRRAGHTDLGINSGPARGAIAVQNDRPRRLTIFQQRQVALDLLRLTPRRGIDNQIEDVCAYRTGVRLAIRQLFPERRHLLLN